MFKIDTNGINENGSKNRSSHAYAIAKVVNFNNERGFGFVKIVNYGKRMIQEYLSGNIFFHISNYNSISLYNNYPSLDNDRAQPEKIKRDDLLIIGLINEEEKGLLTYSVWSYNQYLKMLDMPFYRLMNKDRYYSGGEPAFTEPKEIIKSKSLEEVESKHFEESRGSSRYDIEDINLTRYYWIEKETDNGWEKIE